MASVRFGEGGSVVRRTALDATGELRRTDRRRQPAVPGPVAGQDQQVLLGGQAQFGTEDRADARLPGGFGEPHRTVQTVVVGQGDDLGAQPGRLVDQRLGVAGAVQEAEGGVDVQLGPGRSPAGRWRDGAVRVPVRSRAAQWEGHDLATARGGRLLAVHAPLQFAPGERGVAGESHCGSCSVSGCCRVVLPELSWPPGPVVR